jgi:hypothetical protein
VGGRILSGFGKVVGWIVAIIVAVVARSAGSSLGRNLGSAGFWVVAIPLTIAIIVLLVQRSLGSLLVRAAILRPAAFREAIGPMGVRWAGWFAILAVALVATLVDVIGNAGDGRSVGYKIGEGIGLTIGNVVALSALWLIVAVIALAVGKIAGKSIEPRRVFQALSMTFSPMIPLMVIIHEPDPSDLALTIAAAICVWIVAMMTLANLEGLGCKKLVGFGVAVLQFLALLGCAVVAAVVAG